MADQRAAVACDHCGQTDSDPKVHYFAETYHHDCLPARVRAAVIEADPTDIAETVITECEKGKRGDALLARIEKLHEKAGN